MTGFKTRSWLDNCVVRGQLDPVFSFKDEHKSEQDFKIKYNMYRYWNAVSVGYAIFFNSHEDYNTSYNTCRCTRKLYNK